MPSRPGGAGDHVRAHGGSFPHGVLGSLSVDQRSWLGKLLMDRQHQLHLLNLQSCMSSCWPAQLTRLEILLLASTPSVLDSDVINRNMNWGSIKCISCCQSIVLYFQIAREQVLKVSYPCSVDEG